MLTTWIMSKYRDKLFMLPVKGEAYGRANEALGSHVPGGVTTLPMRLVDYFMTVKLDARDPLMPGYDGATH